MCEANALPLTPQQTYAFVSFSNFHSSFSHLDRHELWVPNIFAIHTFRIVMISIQAQYSYTVIETLMQHLDKNFKFSPKTRTSLAVVLSKIIAIAAGESRLVSYRYYQQFVDSFANECQCTTEESPKQESLINALGKFANPHPDYQKIEIMLFIMNTVPDLSKKSKGDQMLQNIHNIVQYRLKRLLPLSFCSRC